MRLGIAVGFALVLTIGASIGAYLYLDAARTTALDQRLAYSGA